jgi:hypothetical protein
MVKHGIQRSAAAKEEGAAEPLSCHGKWGACQFLDICPRYGTYEQHKNYFDTKKDA